MKKYKTDYESHDLGYKYKKDIGSLGWCEDSSEYEKIQNRILDLFKKTGISYPMKGLDLGCGAGNIALWLAKQKFDISGIDISPTAIDWGKEEAEKENLSINFQVGSAISLEKFGEDSFDFIIDSHCLHCIIGDDRIILFNNVKRILKPDGYFFVMTMCKPVAAEMQAQFDDNTNCLLRNGVHSRYIGEVDDILEEIKKSGLKIVEQEFEIDEVDGNGYLVVIVRKNRKKSC